MSSYRALLAAATLLAFVVVSLGAYVRLSDAGLGCPDWPGCYGHLVGVPDTPTEQSQAMQAFPGKPVEIGKAWKEMVHRYVAGTLGLLILVMTFLAWRHRIAPVTTSVLAAVVAFQAMLGMWTVTLLLKPVIVTAHLLGGMAVVSLLVWLVMDGRAKPLPFPRISRANAPVALLVLLVQIMLGGWVSSNYAALACIDFPQCRSGEWWPPADFTSGFTLHRELGELPDGTLLPFAALTAIHLAHRVWALVVLLVVGNLAYRLLRDVAWRDQGLVLACLLVLQIVLGISTVLLSLPLPLAVAHNFGAAILLAWTLSINLRLRRSTHQEQGDRWGSTALAGGKEWK